MSDTTMDELIGMVVQSTELAEGRPADWVVNTTGILTVPVQKTRAGKAARWTPEEDEYLRQNRPHCSMEDLANHLGRSTNAIKVRVTRMGFTAPRHAPGYISATKIAYILGVDSHAPPTWVDLGLLKGELFPYNGSIKRRVTITNLKMWLVKPTSWVYFDVKRMRPGPLRQLVERAQRQWGDEWLTTRQAADLLDCDPKDIYLQIKLHRIHGHRAIGKERRRVFAWANWYVLRSEIEEYVIPRGRGRIHAAHWSAKADSFILRARDVMKMEFTVIAELMNRKTNAVRYRYSQLKNIQEI